MRRKNKLTRRNLKRMVALGSLMMYLFCIPVAASEEQDVVMEEDMTDEQEDEELIPEKLVHPASLRLQPVKNGIKLTWKAVDNAQSYELYRKTADADKYTLIQTTEKCGWTDKKAKYGITYVYKVRAIAEFESITLKSECSAKKSACTYYVDPSKPMVALTFDDGPSQYTDGILDVLEKFNSRATFFELGKRVNWYPDTVQRIDSIGCEIGNHSYDHPIMGNAATSKIRSEIDTTDKKIKAVTGKKPMLFRPPYGAIGTSLKKNASKPMVLWSIDTLDWQSKNADKVYQSVISKVKDGDIILMHDVFRSTRSAVERIVPELKRRGYQMVTVSELAQYRSVELTAGGRYSQMRP